MVRSISTVGEHAAVRPEQEVRNAVPVHDPSSSACGVGSDAEPTGGLDDGGTDPGSVVDGVGGEAVVEASPLLPEGDAGLTGDAAPDPRANTRLAARTSATVTSAVSIKSPATAAELTARPPGEGEGDIGPASADHGATVAFVGDRPCWPGRRSLGSWVTWETS